jgi:hypothetical protein
MKPSLIFAALFLLTAGTFSCCKSSKKSVAQTEQIQNDSGKTTSNTSNMNAAGEQLMPLKIQFFSIGQGIDFKLKESFLEWVKKYPVKGGKSLDYQEKYWGREGETDICFELKDWEPAAKATFIAEAKQFVSGSKLVHVFENESCVKGR